ncbi:MAG TPA: cytochrome c biogenesis protein, partial [Bryobacteraceae bacterium]|nr:cytochrome c biogenesis protein [Bryobacteraceae bacterium]
PAAFTFMTAAFAAMVASILFLVRKDFRFDAFAASVTEIALVFGAINLATGMIWARIIWGIWWAWDARLTSMLVSCVLYGSYLMLRQAVEESTMRARFSAVLSIFTFPGVVITYKAIDWWRTQHPGPVLSIRGVSGGMDPAMQSVLYLNFLAVLLFATVMVLIRTQQEQTRRELDALRREAHAF